jgi:hypothetical protein
MCYTLHRPHACEHRQIGFDQEHYRACQVHHKIHPQPLMVLNPMSLNIGGKDLVRPASARFATHFLTLQSLLSQAQNLRKMFSIDEWNESQ